METENTFYATGRRKSSIAKTWLKPGNGEITVNGQPVDDYFRFESAKTIATQPLALTNMLDAYEIKVRVLGGGVSGQAGAIRHGISRALVMADQNLRDPLKKEGFLTRDSRMKERKKYGQPGARKRFQYSKR